MLRSKMSKIWPSSLLPHSSSGGISEPAGGGGTEGNEGRERGEEQFSLAPLKLDGPEGASHDAPEEMNTKPK